MIIYVVRHGEAEGNREGRFLGQVNPPLTEPGREQARRQGQMLKGLGIEHILSSDLTRAHTTALIIGGALCLPVHTTALLREVNHGVIDGWMAADINASDHGRAREMDRYNFRPPEGESYKDIEGRILSVLTPPPERRTLLVTHLGPMRVLLHRLCGYTQADAARAKIGHDAVLKLTVTGTDWSGAFLHGAPPDR